VTLEADPLPRLPRETEIVLYRIVQEALQKAHKYARGAGGRPAGAAGQPDAPVDPRRWAWLRPTRGRAARRAEQLGLTSMRERAEPGRRTLQRRVEPGHGTEVSVILAIEG
jgi:two-component system sensor histidine kinase DegS